MKLTILALILTVVLFCLFPEIDLKFSELFYDNGFILEKNPVILFIYFSVRVLCVLTLGVCMYIIIHDYFVAKKYFIPFAAFAKYIRGKFGYNTRGAIFIFLVIVITPGLLVHNVMKPLWDRARPNDVVEFGGPLKFTPIYKFEKTHDGNNSFPSGHAAMAASLMAFGFVAAERRRRTVFTVTGIYTIVASLGRIAQGGHFLSDVTISSLLTLLTIFLVRKYLYKPD